MLPILPDSMSFFLGFGTCGAILAIALALYKLAPRIRAALAPVEKVVEGDWEKGVAFVESKINYLSTSAAKAVNAVRGDVTSIRMELEWLKTRAIALETAVGISAPPAPVGTPSAAPAAAPVPVTPLPTA